MGKIVDLTNQRFARWTVRKLSRNHNGVLYWSCVCDCGTEREVFGGDLKRGGSLSCGCLLRESLGAHRITHSLSYHPAYRSWIGLKSRCENKSSTSYYLYGARGIKVCERWQDFSKFWEDMGATWSSGLSIDRIDVNGDYEPSNCRWATPKEQAMNRRSNTIIDTPKGRMAVIEAAKEFGISQMTISARLRYGWTDPFELVKPPKKTSRVYKRGPR